MTKDGKESHCPVLVKTGTGSGVEQSRAHGSRQQETLAALGPVQAFLEPCFRARSRPVPEAALPGPALQGWGSKLGDSQLHGMEIKQLLPPPTHTYSKQVSGTLSP